jgi:hypothetical protein
MFAVDQEFSPIAIGGRRGWLERVHLAAATACASKAAWSSP